jgi:hypothetical protein
MRVEEAVYNSLRHYPSLYKRDTYEESKREILHHYFIVLGSGIEWAYTKKPEDGGYLTEHEYYKRKKDEDGYPLQKYNKPYHKSGIKIDESYLKKCFEQKMFYVFPKVYGKADTLPIWEVDILTIWEDETDKIDTEIYDLSDVHREFSNTFYKFNPYPNFDKQFSPFWEGHRGSGGLKYIKDDWLEAAIEHLTDCKDFFENPETAATWVGKFNPRELKKDDEKWKLEGRKNGDRLLYYVSEKHWKGDYELLAKLMNEKQMNENLKFLNETLAKLDKIAKDRKA